MNPFRLQLPAAPVDAGLAARVAPAPRVLWIELTSRCPFDCVFCSRRLLRGAGRHMDFALYQRLIAELDAPEIIRLNYSGESSHYPRLVEACSLAAATGADVELVTALAALPAHRVDALALSGLSRLTVSLHTLDAQQFGAIYRFSDVAAMRARIERIVELAPQAPRPLTIDFAFVAMRRNLDQLPAVAAYARELGLGRLAVHPVIRRDPIEETFAEELDGDRLRAEFLDALRERVNAVRAAEPTLHIEASTPELEPATCLDATPRYFPQELPAHGRIHTCDQNPWDTLHVLADGAVVTCEERDQAILGRLDRESLADIWHGAAYARFRADYVAGRDERCRRCPYKQAHVAAPRPRRILPHRTGSTGLLDGWHADGDAQTLWSRPQARLELDAGGAGRLLVRGLLPPGASAPNRLAVRVNGLPYADVVHAGSGMHRFEVRRRVRTTGPLQVAFDVAQAYCPRDRGAGPDARRLGFALLEAAFERDD